MSSRHGHAWWSRGVAVLCGSGYLLCSVWLAVSLAQVPTRITPDTSLGTTVTPNGRVHTITGGTVRGSNLFHSFARFDVGTGETARFTGPNTTIDNIFSRITGSQPSTIDGRIESRIPGAHLYLLNPSGVVFGPNASLDVKGSFHVSTADFLQLTDGKVFNATPGPQDRLLTTAPVAAFGFLSENPAKITIQESELEVPEGQTMSIVGGDIEITGGFFGGLAAPSGKIHIVSVASPGTVIPNTANHVSPLNVENFEHLGEVTISGGAFLDVSGDGGGTVVIRGGNLLVETSFISATTLGASDGAPIGIDMQVAGNVTLTNGTGVTTEVLFGVGDAGDIRVTAEGLVTLRNGGSISSSTSARGKAGSVEVQAGALRVDGVIPGQFTGIASQAASGSSGDAGTVSVTVEGLVALRNGAEISSRTFARGKAGGVEVQAGALRIDDLGTPGQFTGIAGDASSGSSGDAGTVSVTVEGLAALRNGGIISSSTFARGKAGSVEVQAGALRIDDLGTPGQFTGITSQAASGSSGDAGTVSVTVEGLVALRNEGQISSSTFARGKAGGVEVQAGALRIDGVIPGQFTGIASQANEGSSGDAGTVSVTVEGLVTLRNGGSISSSTFARGKAGSVEVQAGALRIDGVIPGQFTGIASQANEGSSGDAGMVTVTVEGLVALRNEGQISSSTLARGKAGDVEVTAGALRIDGSGTPNLAGIFSRAFLGSGDAGMVTVTVEGLVALRNGGIISSSTFTQGKAGDVEVTAGELRIDGSGTPDRSTGIVSQATSGSSGDAGTVSVTVEGLVALRNGGRISSSTFAQGKAGDVEVTAGELRIDDSGTPDQVTGIVSRAEANSSGDAGTVTVTVEGLVALRNGAEISSSTGGPGQGGSVTVTTANAMSLAGQESGLFTNAAGSEPGGNIAVVARSIQLSEGATISAQNSGTGNAGTIDLTAMDAFLSTHSAVTTAAEAAGGGNIIVAAPFVRLTESALTAEAQGRAQQGSDGGNVTIRADVVVLDHSQVQANAFGGNGGSITIAAEDAFLADTQTCADQACLDASSELGVAGPVEVRNPTADLSGIVVPLPQTFTQATVLLPQRCAERLQGQPVSTFVLAGRSSLPAQPGGVLPSPLVAEGSERAQRDPDKARGHGTPGVRPRQLGIDAHGRARVQGWPERGLAVLAWEVACPQGQRE